MADLDIDAVHYIAAADNHHEFSLEDVRSLAAEVIHHRAAKAADRASIIETVRNAVLHFRPGDYVLAEKVATVCARQLASPAAPEPALTGERVRQVVRSAAMAGACEVVEWMMGPTYWHDNPSSHTRVAKIADAIADRAAEQLSGASGALSEADRRALTDLRIREQRALEAIGHLGADVRAGIESTIATLDRLLGVRP